MSMCSWMAASFAPAARRWRSNWKKTVTTGLSIAPLCPLNLESKEEHDYNPTQTRREAKETTHRNRPILGRVRTARERREGAGVGAGRAQGWHFALRRTRLSDAAGRGLALHQRRAHRQAAVQARVRAGARRR